jgi:hypothetical protein
MLVFTGARLAAPRSSSTCSTSARSSWSSSSSRSSSPSSRTSCGASSPASSPSCSSTSCAAPRSPPCSSPPSSSRPRPPHRPPRRSRSAALFSNYIGLKRVILAVDPTRDIVIDFSGARLVDHSVDAVHAGDRRRLRPRRPQLQITGLERHRPDSDAPRRRPPARRARAADLATPPRVPFPSGPPSVSDPQTPRPGRLQAPGQRRNFRPGRARPRGGSGACDPLSHSPPDQPFRTKFALF